MKFSSSYRSAFMKAAGHPLVQRINDNAAKITSVILAVSDCALVASNYMKNGTMNIDLPPTKPEQWMSLGGLSYILASVVFMAGDRFNGIKKPVGVLSCLGASAVAMAAPDSGPALYVAASAPMLTGLSMIFEEQANRAAESLSGLKNAFAKAGRVYLEYPIATMAAAHTVSAISALVQGITHPEQQIMIPYALSWVLGNATFALTDNNVRLFIRSAASPARRESIVDSSPK